jgi:hypothetical protein
MGAKRTHEEYEALLFEREIDYWPIERYILSGTPILHECTNGHQWPINPNNVLRGYGCPYCYGNKRKTQAEYASQVPRDYAVLGDYVNTDTPIEHQHLVCGLIWSPRPHDVLNGSGCPRCATNNLDMPSVVYHVSFEFDGEVFYKLGVTKKEKISSRFRTDWQKFNMKVIWKKHFDSGLAAYAYESSLLREYKHLLYNTGLLISGNTETLIQEIPYIEENPQNGQ